METEIPNILDNLNPILYLLFPQIKQENSVSQPQMKVNHDSKIFFLHLGVSGKDQALGNP